MTRHASTTGEPKVVAIVPARGGSKSVPRKNVKLLAGRPLIWYTITEAKRSRLVDRVIVTTEDLEIATVSGECGAEVPFLRPAELASDSASDLEVFQHCLQWLHENEGCLPDLVVHLRPTAPLRRAEHIDAAIELMKNSPPDVDAIRSVTTAPVHPLKMWRITDDLLQPFVPGDIYGIPEPYNLPRQVLPLAFIQNGSVDVIRARVILKQNSMTGSRIRPLVMPESESVNIDSPIDWAMAERRMQQRGESAVAAKASLL